MKTAMSTRFDGQIPGTIRMLWLMMRHRNDWEQRCRAIIKDTHSGQRFQVTEEENAIMDMAMEATQETPTREIASSGRQLNRALELMSDELFLAMYERRHGNEAAWSRFADMSPDDWRVWWARHEAQARIEARRAA